MTVHRWRYALTIGAHAGAVLFALTASVVVTAVAAAAPSRLGYFLAFGASGVVGAAGACLAAYGAYRNDLEAERRRTGCCPRCGYDLRESTARCPECGRPFRRG